MRRHLICAAVCAVVCSPACAELVELGEEILKAMVAGKTVHLDTPFGVAIPITYHGNGLMSGKAGVLEYFLGAQADRGRWWVANGKLCQKWFKWLDAEPNCMHLKQEGNKILWRRDDGLSGPARGDVRDLAKGRPLGAAGGDGEGGVRAGRGVKGGPEGPNVTEIGSRCSAIGPSPTMSSRLPKTISCRDYRRTSRRFAR